MNMRMYLSLFKTRAIRSLQYRAAAMAGVVTQFFWGFIIIMVFQAFYASTSAAQDISFVDLVQMLWLRQGLLFIFMLWYRDGDIINLITSGNISYELCRPTDLYSLWFVKTAAQKIAGAALRCVPIFLVTFFLPAPYNLKLPPNISSGMLFLVALILGAVLSISIAMLIFISVFYTLSPTGSYLLIGVLGEFLSGAAIPVPLMPQALRNVVDIMPFRYTWDLPFRIYSGNIGVEEAISGILFQVAWIAILILLGKAWMRNALKKVVIQGG